MKTGSVCARTTSGIIDAIHVGPNDRSIDGRRCNEPARVQSQRRSRAAKPIIVRTRLWVDFLPGPRPEGRTGQQAPGNDPQPCPQALQALFAHGAVHVRGTHLRDRRYGRLKPLADESVPPASVRGPGIPATISSPSPSARPGYPKKPSRGCPGRGAGRSSCLTGTIGNSCRVGAFPCRPEYSIFVSCRELHLKSPGTYRGCSAGV